MTEVQIRIHQQTEPEPMVSVAAVLTRSRVNGPFTRAVLWVQGCPRRCSGCCNPLFQEFTDHDLRTPLDVADMLLTDPAIEGITFSGGEPFSQASGLAIVAEQAQNTGKGMVIFTGFTYAELLASEDQGIKSLLGHTDMLVAGPYLRDMPSPHPLLASANQEIVHLTDRYRNWTPKAGKRAEFKISGDGAVLTTGLAVLELSGNLSSVNLFIK
jgi:anaerobic ribonucleoside-triphosphate reductase activating protein